MNGSGKTPLFAPGAGGDVVCIPGTGAIATGCPVVVLAITGLLGGLPLELNPRVIKTGG